MSSTTVSNVTFTNNNKYNATTAINNVGVDTSQPIGTVIYIPASGDANICTNTSGLEYTIGSNTLKIDGPSLTGLTKEKYYVVIDDKPCGKSLTKKFFDCQPPVVAPKPKLATALSAAPPAAPSAASPTSLVSALAITKFVRFDTATINGMFTDNSKVYVCPAVNAKGECISTCLFKTSIPLNTIFKKHYETQVKIVDSLKTETNVDYINKLHEFINGLYNYVNTTTPPDFTAFNNKYAKIVTEVGINVELMQLQSNFRTLIFNKATKKKHLIEKDRYDNLLVTSDTINSKLPNITTDSAKMKYILMESINNFFYILLFKLVNEATITVDATLPNAIKITGVKVNNIPILLSKLNNVNAKIHIKYYLSTENIKNVNPHIFYKGIDTSILAEVDITDTKTLNCSLSAPSILIVANAISYTFTKIDVRGISTITGGSRKTKKRNQISKKQIRKTKKQSRNHKK